jgi:hypothetical protein
VLVLSTLFGRICPEKEEEEGRGRWRREEEEEEEEEEDHGHLIFSIFDNSLKFHMRALALKAQPSKSRLLRDLPWHIMW